MSIALLPEAPALSESAAQGPDLTRYFLVCAGLLLLVLALAWFFRRFVAEGIRRRAAKRSLRVVDVLPLGGRQKVVVVSCYDRTFLLGLGDKEVHSIAELDAVPETELVPAAAATVDPAATPENTAADGEPAAADPFPVSLAEAMREPTPIRDKDRRRLERWRKGEGIIG